MPPPRLLLPALHTSSRRACARGWACVPLDGGSDRGGMRRTVSGREERDGKCKWKWKLG